MSVLIAVRVLFSLGLLVLMVSEGNKKVSGGRIFNRKPRNTLVGKSVVSNRDVDFPKFGQVIDKNTVDGDTFRRIYDSKWPVVIRNVFSANDEQWTEQLIEKLGPEDVEFDVRTSSSGEVETFSSSMQDFLSVCGRSTHEKSFYLMNEHVLDSVQDMMREFDLPIDYFGENYFNSFPLKIRPRTALIIGGGGARSFLHADPFEWTGIGTSSFHNLINHLLQPQFDSGWNHLLEGRKLWIFFPPDDHEVN